MQFAFNLWYVEDCWEEGKLVDLGLKVAAKIKHVRRGALD